MKRGVDARRWVRLESDQRRAQILATAQRLFSQRPFGEVSTTEIADAAGVTRGLLHHYFGTKRELYLEAVRGLVGLTGADEAPEVGPVSWEQGVDVWMEYVEANREAWLAAVTAGETGRDQAMTDILEEVRERTATQVLLALGLDEEATPEVRPLVRAFGGLAEQASREWLERQRISREQARVLLLETLPLLVQRLLPELVASRPRRAG